VATVAYTNAFLAVNGTDVSQHVAELTLNYSAEMLDETAMGDSNRVFKGGLKNWSVDVTFHQDFAAGGPDALLFPLVGVTACIELRPVNACSSATNPSYSGTAILDAYPPMGGSVGALLNTKGSFKPGGSSPNLSRASSS
jgi:hypothetical protein